MGVVLIGDSLRTAKLAERLFERGINTIPVTYPAVPMRSARLRFFLTSDHTREQIAETLRVTREEIDAIMSKVYELKDPGAIAGYLDGYKDRFSYYLPPTGWNVKGGAS